jgi:hypothetical protein
MFTEIENTSWCEYQRMQFFSLTFKVGIKFHSWFYLKNVLLNYYEKKWISIIVNLFQPDQVITKNLNLLVTKTDHVKIIAIQFHRTKFMFFQSKMDQRECDVARERDDELSDPKRIQICSGIEFRKSGNRHHHHR